MRETIVEKFSSSHISQDKDMVQDIFQPMIKS